MAERAWRAFWPLATIVVAFGALALFDLLPQLDGWLHLGVLIAAAAAAAWALRRGVIRFAWPGTRQARRRLERDSGLSHRPLTILFDDQALGTDDTGSRSLWQRERVRAAAAIQALRLSGPHDPVADEDRFALRGLTLLVAGIAVIGAGADWPERLADAWSPSFRSAGADTPARLDLFVTPPAYTDWAPMYLTADGNEDGRILEIPVGSALTAQVTGGNRPPVLTLGTLEAAFEPVGTSDFHVDTEVMGGDRLTVSQDGRSLADWPLTVIPDHRPEAQLSESPGASDRGVLRIPFGATDDYGVTAMTVRVSLADPEMLAGTAIDLDDVVLDLSIPASHPVDYEGLAYFDLTPHPWAGLPVTLSVVAADAIGQEGASEPAELVLPERTFQHPVAQAIIDQRRTLLRDPEAAIEVAETLETLSVRPDRYYDDPVVFLALRTAGLRLRLAETGLAAGIDPIQRLLWDTALRIEDGDLSLAEAALRDAQQALRDALARGADDEEIRRLTEELRQAMDRYLAALQQEMMNRLARGGEFPTMSFDPETMVIDRQDLDDLLDRLQQLSESGAREEAMALLSELQQLMEGLQPMPQMGQSPEAAQAEQLLRDLQDLIEAQQALLDQTYQDQQQQGQPGQPGGGSGSLDGQSAATQDALRRALGEIMREMGELTGEIPPALGRAEQDMRQSEQALRTGRPDQAIGPQSQAIEEMSRGLQGFVEQIMDRMAGAAGVGPPRNQGGRDPLGRPLDGSGQFATDDVEIPSEADTQRAREILDELRRRFGDRDRPDTERNYIERLLRQF